MPAATDRCLMTWFSVAAALTVGMAVSHAEQTEDDTRLLSRSKRQANCAPKFQITPGHTACLSGPDASEATSAEQQEILNQHNQFRTNANPTASNMMRLKWDAEIAMLAQKWADNCHFGHDTNRNIPGRLTVGQNIAGGASSWTQAVTLWHSEVANFTYNDQAMNNKLMDIGHYTEVMWAKTTLVGCAKQTCNGKIFHVCNYAESGNFGGQLHVPYKSGSPCADCPGHCSNSLCDCQRTCLNGGTLDLATCTCSCQVSPSLYMPPDCALNCSGSDDSWCAGQGTCPDHSVWCPNKCGVCPYAGVGYAAPSTGTPEVTTTTTSTTTPEVTTTKPTTTTPKVTTTTKPTTTTPKVTTTTSPPPNGAPERMPTPWHYLTSITMIVIRAVSRGSL